MGDICGSSLMVPAGFGNLDGEKQTSLNPGKMELLWVGPSVSWSLSFLVVYEDKPNV